MIELLEKRKYDEVLKKLETMEHISEVVDFIAEEVKKAYQAGLLQFNAVDHSVVENNSRKSITAVNYNFEIGEPFLLTSFYLKEKGFTC